MRATREFVKALVKLNSPDNPYKCEQCETWVANDTVSCADCYKDFMPVATELNTDKIHILIAARAEALRKKAEEALRKKSQKKGLPIEKEAAAPLDNTDAQAQLSSAMLKRAGELNDAVEFYRCTNCTHAKAEADAAAAAKVEAAAANAENQPETCKQLTGGGQVVNTTDQTSDEAKRTRKPVNRYKPTAELDNHDPQSGPQEVTGDELVLFVDGDEEISNVDHRLRFIDSTMLPKYLAFFQFVVAVHEREGISGHAKSAHALSVYSNYRDMINFCHGGWQYGLNKRPKCMERPDMLGMYCRKCLLKLLGRKPLYLLELLKCWGEYKLHVFWVLRIQAELETFPADWNGVQFTAEDFYLCI